MNISSSNDNRSSTWFEITSCQGAVRNCPHVLQNPDNLIRLIRELLERKFDSLLAPGESTMAVPPHKRLRIAVACCPNACSQPQIMDFGLIASCQMQKHTDTLLCTRCNRCVNICRERAIVPENGFSIETDACAGCGDCLPVCESKARIALKTGWKILAGGKLGRHPCLAQEIAIYCSDERAVAIIGKCLNWFVIHKGSYERFSDTVYRIGVQSLQEFIKE